MHFCMKIKLIKFVYNPFAIELREKINIIEEICLARNIGFSCLTWWSGFYVLVVGAKEKA